MAHELKVVGLNPHWGDFFVPHSFGSKQSVRKSKLGTSACSVILQSEEQLDYKIPNLNGYNKWIENLSVFWDQYPKLKSLKTDCGVW